MLIYEIKLELFCVFLVIWFSFLVYRCFNFRFDIVWFCSPMFPVFRYVSSLLDIVWFCSPIFPVFRFVSSPLDIVWFCFPVCRYCNFPFDIFFLPVYRYLDILVIDERLYDIILIVRINANELDVDAVG